MISLKVLSTAAAIALLLPVVTPSQSSAQGQPAGVTAGGGGAGPRGVGGFSGGGGAAAIGGGGGFRGGGGGAVAPGGGGFRGGGMAVAPSGGGIRGGGVAVAPGSPGFRAGAVASTEGRGTGFVRPAPGVGGGTVAGGTWHGGRHFHHRHHRHRHGGFWPGFAIGAGIGSAYGYYGSPYYYDDPYYYDETVVAAGPPVGDDAVAYCMRRYKSYDPASGTYLGYDGQRHPCPAQ
ncbi:BA14K family protein [Bradyrhizobium sp. sBnM-33]|uniref:BA14K family protein n=2 Tax=unclassified Bradyrhizobium TaxID=2631580 RepID=UPI001BD086EA|nr:BA14K family protein [Bradyrhizobium sp. sBnM-33]WOH47844.1 BA14K family protein [Bradyrhizobium sp. sBnM-33]